MTTYANPFNRPAFMGREAQYIQQGIAGDHASDNVPFTGKTLALRDELPDASRALVAALGAHTNVQQLELYAQDCGG